MAALAILRWERRKSRLGSRDEEGNGDLVEEKEMVEVEEHLEQHARHACTIHDSDTLPHSRGFSRQPHQINEVEVQHASVASILPTPPMPSPTFCTSMAFSMSTHTVVA